MHIELPSLSVPRLTAWPTGLKAPVLRWSRLQQDQASIELPAAFWRHIGIAEKGRYAVAQFEDAFLFWPGAALGITQDISDSGFMLFPKPPSARESTYDVAFGEGYAVLAPREVLDQLAPDAPHRRGFQGFHRNLQGSAFAQQAHTAPDLGPLHLDPSEVYGWCDATVSGAAAIAHFGNFVVALCGFPAKASILAQRYDDAYLLTLAPAGTAGTLAVQEGRTGYRSLFVTRASCPSTVTKRVRAIATTKGLVTTAIDGPFSHLCTKANQIPTQSGGLPRARWVRAHPLAVATESGLRLGGVEFAGLTLDKPADQLYQNTAVYPMARSNARLQVHGHWLSRFGFEPGTRYRIEPHPAFKQRLRAVPDPSGRHKVTQYNGIPKLYIPTAALPWGDADFVRVIGRPADGLMIGRSTTAS